MSIETMRVDFEAWECDSDQGPQTDPVWLMYDAKTNTYPLDKIQDRWEVWQASRESLVIELPEPFEYDSPGEAAPAIKGCREAIHDAGVKTK